MSGLEKSAVEQRYAGFCAKMGRYDFLRSLPRAGHMAPQSRFVNFASNDYLGLRHDSRCIQAGVLCAKRYGGGSGSARLLLDCDTNELFEQFERTIAADLGQDAALLFSSGYQMNTTVLSALLDVSVLRDKPVVLMDHLCHASLRYGCEVAGVQPLFFAHNDLDHCVRLLENHQNVTGPRFIITETMFSMNGDGPNLQHLADIKREWDAFCILDEAHAIGVLGPDGLGLASEMHSKFDCVMGTFGKALGCMGAYIASSHTVHEYLVNKASGFMYSTAPSPFVIGMASCAWDMLKGLSDRRRHLKELGQVFAGELCKMGWETGASHIVPVVTGKKTLEAHKALAHAGMAVPRIRFPTVPLSGERLRFSLTNSHLMEDIYKVLNVLLKFVPVGCA